MRFTKPRALVDIEYEKAAQAYLRSLPLEHFMEATPQATQRKITLESLDLVQAQRPDVQVFNELLIQYPHGRPPKIRQVVPDNMVVVHDQPLKAMTSYNLPLQPARPFWVMEYVSKGSERKDYEDSFAKYEKELKVPYYLVFYPDNEELTLYKSTTRGYRSVKPNGGGRYPIPQLEMEIELCEGWVRFWFRGAILPLPAELLGQLNQTRHQLDQARQQLDVARQRADEEAEARQALEEEVARLRRMLGQPPAGP